MRTSLLHEWIFLQMEAIIAHIILDFFVVFERRIQICENYFSHSTSRNMKRTRFEKHLFPKTKSRGQFCNFIKINIRRRIWKRRSRADSELGYSEFIFGFSIHNRHPPGTQPKENNISHENIQIILRRHFGSEKSHNHNHRKYCKNHKSTKQREKIKTFFLRFENISRMSFFHKQKVKNKHQ